MQDSYIAFIDKSKRSKDIERILGPSKVRITKTLIRNLVLLKYCNGLPCLLILFAFTQGAIIIMNIAMDANFGTILGYLIDERRMAAEHYRGDKKGWRPVVLPQSI